ncbi:MAG: helix-turn-helix transcriptional regulator, partial [Rubrivivax sp.]|nr:helix-turn-helix transcriptional regulator [Rubrivivax sp.]
MSQVWRFGRFELQPAQRRLLADGRPLELGARALDLLATLVERAGALVSKDELLDRVWAGAVVEEANLHVQVSALRKLLGRDAIATVPGRGYQFVLPLATGSAAPAATTPPAADAGLPPLLGRDEDLVRVAQALARGGFVTVTGAGGSGKTLLARHLVARHGTLDGSPAAWVDLVELDAAPAVVPAVAAALQVHGPPRDAAALAQALAAERRLLVLDNAEHLLDTVGELVDALRAQARGLALLVTSQAPLHRRGEVVHALAGLPVPALPCTADEALRHAAVALFVAHARQADRRFRFGDAQVADVVAVCASLGGSALGVQLAAALLGQMTLAELRERLAGRATGPDAAAVDPASNVLRSALSWSHDLLSPAARRVFRRLAVVQGPLPLALVLATASDGGDADDETADALADLVERSLVQCEPAPDAPPDASPRYRLLEAPRALALEQLHEAGERGEALARLACALAPLGDALHEVDWGGREEPGRDAALRARQPVAADIVAAFEVALALPGAEGAATAARLAELLVRVVLARPAAERLRWAQALRERADAAGLPLDLRARALDAA